MDGISPARSGLAVVLTALLLGGLAGVTVGAAADHPGSADADFDAIASSAALDGDVAAAQTSGPTVVIDRVLDQRGDPAEEVYLTLRYDIPATITELRVSGVPAETNSDADVVSTDGFDADGENTYAWDESTNDPTITVEYTLPTTQFRSGDHGTAGDDWAFLSLPTYRHDGRYTGQEPSFAYDQTIRGNGTATDAYAYLGEYDHYSEEAYLQTFHLYVPDGATLAEEPDTLLSYYVDASQQLDVGGRDEQVHGFAIPSAGRTVSPSGVQRGPNSFYVDAGAEVGGDETWVHEYVHTRQQWQTDATATWLYEGSASYYGIVLRAHSTNWTEERLYDRMAGSQPGTLSQPTSWTRLTPYVEGRQFLAHLNLRLRQATDGDVTVTQVIRDLNTDDDRITHDVVVETIREYDGATAAWADETLTSESSLDAPRDPEAYVFRGSEPDDDGLNVTMEERYGSSPFATDTDEDGLDDDEEVELSTDPTNQDTDGDGIPDAAEAGGPTDPTNVDTDGDGVDDGVDDCPTEAGDGDRGCPVTETATDANRKTDVPGETIEADGPVGPAPFVALLVVALAARRLARRE